MYCNGIDEATLKATLKAKFEETDDGWINNRLNDEVSARENYKNGQSESGKIGQFWKKAKKFLAKKDYEILRKEFINKDLVLEFIETNEVNKGTLEGLLKHIANADAIVNKDKEVINKKEDQKIIEFFNSTCTRLSKVQILSDVRKKKIAARLHEVGYDKLTQIITEVSNSDFLNGDNPRGWTADFDWILEPRNFTKILEGNYKNKNNGSHAGTTNYTKPNNTRINGRSSITPGTVTPEFT